MSRLEEFRDEYLDKEKCEEDRRSGQEKRTREIKEPEEFLENHAKPYIQKTKEIIEVENLE